MSVQARLIQDGGRSAAGPDFFRSADFLRSEGVTHSLLALGSDAQLALPVIVREVPGTRRRDAVSPYGYPAGRLHGSALDPEDLDLTSTGLVSLFVRDRLGDQVLRGGTRRSTVYLHDPTLARHVHKKFAYQVRRNERHGMTVDLVAGSGVETQLLIEFAEAYKQTMLHVGAADSYLFSLEYLRTCVNHPQSWMTVTRTDDGELAAATISVVSDGVLHYFLGGTADAHRSASPVKNTFVRMLDLADDLDMPLNLGGGVGSDDGLERFKQGFSNRVEHFVTHELIGDPAEYARLCAGNRPTEFFPAYRAG